MRIRSSTLAIVLGCLAAVPAKAQPAQWSRLKLDTLYETVSACNPNCTSLDDVINLRPNPSNFMGQSLANPHVVIPDDLGGDWLISTYGTLLDPNGDSIYFITRGASQGQYTIPSTPTLVGAGLGAGAALVKAPTATVTGRRYFALVPILSIGGQEWITWAARDPNSSTWSFLGSDGTAVSDPSRSVRLIRRSDYAGGHWQHPALIYASVQGVDYFFVNLGYAGNAGVTACWFRLKFDPTNANGFGLKFDSTLNAYLVQRFNGTSFIDTNGQVPSDDSWQIAAMSPSNPPVRGMQPAEPMDVVSLIKADGSFDSFVFLYTPAWAYGNSPTKLAYVKGSPPATGSGMFQWSTPHLLDSSILWDRVTFPTPRHTYNSCGSGGGNFMSLNQGTGSTAGMLFGFLSAFRDDIYAPANPGCFYNCASQPQGLLPILLKQQSMGVDSVSPSSGSRNGGYTVSVAGEGFGGSTSFTIGGAAATNVVVGSATSVSGIAPAHLSGVTNLKMTSAGSTEVLSYAFVYDFDDMPSTHPYHDYVTKLVRTGVTGGCGGNSFCPDVAVTRAQMAPFLLKARHGFRYVPPPPPPSRDGEPAVFFTDVPSTDPFAPWIDQLFRMGVTAGCSGTTACDAYGTASYCPSSAVLRQQMAVFLFKTLHWNNAPVPPCSQTGISVPDVTCPSTFADYIYDAVKYGHMLTCGSGSFVCTGTCRPGDFCPTAQVSRKDMAQHLVDTFDLR